MEKANWSSPPQCSPGKVTASGSATQMDPQEGYICRIWPARMSSQPGTTGLSSKKYTSLNTGRSHETTKSNCGRMPFTCRSPD